MYMSARKMKLWISWTVVLLLGALVLLPVAFRSAGQSSDTQPDPVVPALSSLIDTISVRLSLADRVALSKWETKIPVEDMQREQAVLVLATTQAREHQLDPLRAQRFFAAQIEANKLIQYGLLWKWSQTEQPPPGTRPDLINEIRPQLDRLQKILLEQLSRFEAYRKDSRCQQWVSAAVINRSQDELHQWALVRATGGLCD